jgi:hypothetical protein
MPTKLQKQRKENNINTLEPNRDGTRKHSFTVSSDQHLLKNDYRWKASLDSALRKRSSSVDRNFNDFSQTFFPAAVQILTAIA